MRETIKKLGTIDERGYEYALAKIDALVPDSENPRIPLQDSALDTLLALLREDPDGLYALARDIVKMGGTNPAELLNVTEVEGRLIVREGNRRLAARKILRNPEQLRDHVSATELERWSRLANEKGARHLPEVLMVVLGQDHDPWVDRRHLGPQGGAGLVSWNPQAKARRDARRRGKQDRTLQLLDGLRTKYPSRFQDLQPPPRTFTTFVRLLDSKEGRSQIGLDVDEHGNQLLQHGERSLRLLEEILRDLRRTDREKLTSRRIHSTEQISDYLAGLESRIAEPPSRPPIALQPPEGSAGASRPSAPAVPRKRTPSLITIVGRPEGRLGRILEELNDAKKRRMPNALLVLIRVFLELSLDQYATSRQLSFEGDRNLPLEAEIKSLLEQLNRHNIALSKELRRALKDAARQPTPLTAKLHAVIDDLVTMAKLSQKEAVAKKRELKTADVLPLLNDAVHRHGVSPSIEGAEHLLDVLVPVLREIHHR